MITRLLVLLPVCIVLLAACGVPMEIETNPASIGGANPEETVVEFFTHFNEALRDPELSEETTRRAYAERLASYFTPSERVDQRYVLGQMLAEYAARLEEIDQQQEITLEVTYEGVRVRLQDEDEATVHLLDGALHFRRVYVAENGYRSVLRDDQFAINEAVGLGENNGFPVLRVGERWFLTER